MTSILKISLFALFCVLPALSKKNFLLYDVNPGEGFNLRRDVYIRMANTIRFLNINKRSDDKWTLVLPPWGHLYHWFDPSAIKIPWKTFFNVNALGMFIPVIELEDFINENYESKIDVVFNLQHFDMSASSFKWDDRIETNTHCVYYDFGFRQHQGFYHYMRFYGYEDKIRTTNFTCLFAMTDSKLLASFLNNEAKQRENLFPPKENKDLGQVIYINHAEVVIHGYYSEWSPEYWTGRRSLVFAAKLREIGDRYRQKHLSSTDYADRTVPPSDWRIHPWPSSPAMGGPYAALHLRRGDFARSAAPRHVPALSSVASQLMAKLLVTNNTDLRKVFIATDATEMEKQELMTSFTQVGLDVYYFLNQDELSPGEVAIVDQWICAHARFFMGTLTSTFSMRIMEEREIMGFPAVYTCNSFCGQKEACEQPTHWAIKYESAFSRHLPAQRDEF